MQASAQDAIVAWRTWSWPGAGPGMVSKDRIRFFEASALQGGSHADARGFMSVRRRRCGDSARV